MKRALWLIVLGIALLYLSFPGVRDWMHGRRSTVRDQDQPLTEEVELRVKPQADKPSDPPAAVVKENRVAGPSPAPGGAVAEAPGEWLLMVDDAEALATLRAAAAQMGWEAKAQPSLLAVRLAAPSRQMLDAWLARTGIAVRATPNRQLQAQPPPQPPAGVDYVAFDKYVLEWLGLAKRPENWGEGVTLAVLDTAFDPSSAAFAQSSAQRNAQRVGSSSHGLAVASIIGGRGGDLRGVAPGTALLSVPVLGEDGSGSSFALASAIVAAVDAEANVINLSLGCRHYCPVLEKAVGYAADAGVVIVAAVGNAGQEGLFWPARDPSTLAVGAVDAKSQHLWFNNTGEQIDLAAPGLALAAAVEGGEGVGHFSGTSAAAPVVSALLAGVMSENPSMSAAEAAELLCAYADEAGPGGVDDYFGCGVVSPVRVMARDTPGLVDLGVAPAWVEPVASVDSDAIVQISVQNRGTESVDLARLVVSFAGSKQDWLLQDVAPGQVIVRDVRVSAHYLRNGSVDVDYGITLVGGAQDLEPKNNVRRVTLSLPEQE